MNSDQIRTDVVKIIIDLGIFLGDLETDHYKPSLDEYWAVDTARRYWPSLLSGVESLFEIKPGDAPFTFVRK